MVIPVKLSACIALSLALLSAAMAAEDENANFKLHREEPTPFVEGAWTVVVIPDTQSYLRGKNGHHAHIVDTMMDWIVEEKDKRCIKMVVHVGDMTHNNNTEQWNLIRSSYRKLDNVLPYVVCEGNHDVGKKTGVTRMNEFFTIDENPLNKVISGGAYKEGQLQNACYLMEQNGMKYLFLAIGWKAGRQTMAWADNVVKSHPDHRVFVTVHTYISEESRMLSSDGRPALRVDDKMGVFKGLAEPNGNVEFITCGHVGPRVRGAGGKLEYTKELATAHRSDKKAGATLHQLLLNAQFAGGNGGDGWLLLMEFAPDNKTVRVKTFSPFLKQWRTGTEYEYVLDRTEGHGR